MDNEFNYKEENLFISLLHRMKSFIENNNKNFSQVDADQILELADIYKTIEDLVAESGEVSLWDSLIKK